MLYLVEQNIHFWSYVLGQISNISLFKYIQCLCKGVCLYKNDFSIKPELSASRVLLSLPMAAAHASLAHYVRFARSYQLEEEVVFDLILCYGMYLIIRVQLFMCMLYITRNSCFRSCTSFHILYACDIITTCI
jgi:hypothetical protein